MVRENGFYWVCFNGKWEISEYIYNKYWMATGSSLIFTDEDFNEIDENQLERPGND